MKKLLKAVLVFLFVSLVIKSDAQNIMHAIGFTSGQMSGISKEHGASTPYNFTLLQLTYQPRYLLIENENSSISTSLPISGGIVIASNTGTQTKGINFAYDLPVVLDYNFGTKSTLLNDKMFGGLIGAGFSYYSATSSQGGVSNFTSYGPLFRIGGRFGSKEEYLNGRAVSVILTGKKGIEKQSFFTMNVSILLDL